MTDRLHVNRTSLCGLCWQQLGRGETRVRLGDTEDGDGPRLAICPVHDIAGPVEALPDSLRRTLTP